MTTKRNLKNELEELKDDPGDGGGGIVIDYCNVIPRGKQWPDMADSPHPELTIRPYPEKKPKTLKVAVPNLISNEYLTNGFLTVATCDKSESHRIDPDADGTMFACDLWDALTEEELEEEYLIREEEGEPIPALLEDYAPEE